MARFHTLIVVIALLALGCGSSGWSAYGENDPDENMFVEERLRILVTVSYLEQFVLPPNSTVRAALFDESHELKPAISSNAETTRAGRGVPVELEVTYPLDQIDDSHEYVIRGEITDPTGALLFTTEEPIEVIMNEDREEPVLIELILKRAPIPS